MTRTTHNRLLDHEETDLDTNVVLDGALSAPASTSSGDTVHQALEDLNTAIGAAGGGGPEDLITGNDSTFAASLGSWTNSGGTMTRDTGVKLPGFTASLKHVTNSTNQYVELPISGTFRSGQQYWAILFIQPPASSVTPTITLGLIGTDSAARAIPVQTAEFACIGVPWTPTADRTGVKLRLLMPPTTTTYYIGWAKCFLSIPAPLLNIDATGNASQLYTPLGTNTNISIGSSVGTTNGSLSFRSGGSVDLSDSQAISGIQASPSAAYIFCQHTAGALAGEGVWIGVGIDALGLLFSEKDSTTIQVYDDSSGAYNIELVDQGSFGFKTVNTTYSTALSNLHYVKAGTADPSAGGGVAAPIGATYHRDNSGAGELWLKTGASNTAWSKFNNP